LARINSAKNRSSGVLRVDQRLPAKERCREHSFSEASSCLRLRKYGGIGVAEVKLKEFQADNVKLKKLPAESV
jgi:hypothetical protein